MTLDSSREWSDDEGEGQDVLDPFNVCRIKLYNILCVYLPDLAQQIDDTQNIQDEERLRMALLFDDETFDCTLKTRILLSQKTSNPEHKPFGFIGETSTRVAEINQETVLQALQFIQENLRMALVGYLEDRRDHIIADVETELKRWDKREHVTAQVDELCNAIRELPYLHP